MLEFLGGFILGTLFGIAFLAWLALSAGGTDER